MTSEPSEHRPGDGGRVVVITGASAGVGRATAHAFAATGARLGLIARDPEGLRGVLAEVNAAGAEAVILPLDVADPEAVFAAAARCEAALGPIDVWINNAMVTVFSPVTDLAVDELRRVTEVTYLGCAYGTMAALRHMLPRDRGVIVQVGSALAYRGLPLQAAYCGAKHAARGFTDALRAELDHIDSGVRLTTVHLPAINTPQFDWARTHRSALPRPVAPVYAPVAAARTILRAAGHPSREYWMGGSTGLLILANALAPRLLDRYLAAKAVAGQARMASVAAERRDNLFEPVPGLHRTAGAFGAEERLDAIALPSAAARWGALIGAGLIVAAAGATIGAAVARRPPRGASRPRKNRAVPR